MERADFYWANEETRTFMRRGYLSAGETVESRVRAIADYAESLLKTPGFADKFYKYMARGWYSLATPVWANFGKQRGLPISCYGSFMEDTTESILYTASEVGMMSKQGGGTSVYFGKLRPRGAPITDNGVSNGSYSFARLFDRVIEVFNQGSTRRGQCAAYIDIEHPDIEEWLQIHREGSDVQHLFWGVCVGDDWLESMKQGDHKKRQLWAKVLQSRTEVGIPYLFFKDNANNGTVDVYKDLGKTIYASNLCVVGSSLAVTSEGIRRVKDLYEEGKPLTLFDGEKPVPASPMQLIERNADVYTITTKAGRKHTVTGYHKVKTQRGMVPACELKPGDRVAIQASEGLFGSWHDPKSARWLGKKHAAGDTDYLSIPDWLFRSNKPTQSAYLSTLLNERAIGCLSKDRLEQIALPFSSEPFLRHLQVLLTNLGVLSEISPLVDGLLAHECTWQLVIRDPLSLARLEALTGVCLRSEGSLGSDLQGLAQHCAWDEVVSVEYAGKEDVYCCTVYTDEHVWVCDGIITSNCTEIMLPASADESFVCCLSSMNLLHYDEWKDTDAVETMVFFLDTVMEDFIRRVKDIPFMERAYNFASRHRALGLGVLGWHSLLQSKRIPIESMDAYRLNVEIFRTIRDRAYNASMDLARRFGEPEYLKGYGRRNTTLMAIAPTKSSSFILGQVSPSIEPFMSNYFVKDLEKNKIVFRNPYLQQVLQERGKDDDRVWRSIAERNGSVQHLDFLSEEERDVFKTFSEISQMTLVQQAAQRQQFIDQGQSLNMMIHPDATARDINALVLEAHRLGLKSLYYQYSSNAAQEFNRELLFGCQVCES